VAGNWSIGVTGSPRAYGSRTANYAIWTFIGCHTYFSCDLCTLDPNCGWCRNGLTDPSFGFCVPGIPSGPSGAYCLSYSYSTCDYEKDQIFTLKLGVIVGMMVGAVVIMGAGSSIILIWRRYNEVTKKNLRPATLQSANSNFVINFEEKEKEAAKELSFESVPDPSTKSWVTEGYSSLENKEEYIDEDEEADGDSFNSIGDSDDSAGNSPKEKELKQDIPLLGSDNLEPHS